MNEDLAAIHQLVTDVDALQSDPDGFTGLLTDDVVIVNFGGRLVRGRGRMHEAMSQALASPLADVITTNEIEDIQFLRPDVALVICTKRIDDKRPTRDDSLPETGIFTLVLVKNDGTWQVAKAQTTPVR